MPDPTHDELAAQLAAKEREVAALRRQLAAQSGDTYAGDRGVAAQSIQDSTVISGDANRLIRADVYNETVIHQIIADATQTDAASLRLAYLAHLYQQVSALDLFGIDRAARENALARFHLDAIYTALWTEQSEADERHLPTADPGKARPLSAVAQLDRQRHLVLLGEPGSGKSTFVNFVVLCLAGEKLQQATQKPFAANLALLTAPLPDDEEKAADANPQPWRHGALLPVRVILRDFAAQGLPPARTPATATHLWDFICAQLTNAGLSDCHALLRKELLEQGGLILLDGLDEVPEAENRRVQLRQVIESVAALFTRCRILVTSRTYAYQKQAWRLDGFATALLAPLTEAQIRNFVDRWYAHAATQRRLDPNDAQGRATLLKAAIFRGDRLRALAERPLLLTLMATLHAWRGGNLPEGREELYADAVELLLDRWEKQRTVRDAAGDYVVIQPSLAEFLKVERAQLQAVLNRLAYELHSGQTDLVGVANLDEADLVAALLAISRNAQVNPLLLVDYLSERAGLLLPHGVGLYSFPHRTFQEYLAACHLTGEEFYPEALADLARSAPNRWREVALLAGAKAARGTPSALWLLIDALCYRNPTETGYNAEDSWGALLAAQALVETVDLSKISARNGRKVATVRQGLLHLLRQGELPALERARAGQLLATLGDPRPELLAVEQMEFCYVPAGPFVMGEGEAQHTNSYLDYAYWLARYPVTNAHFQRFVDAGGYANAAYWPEAIAAEFWQKGQFKGRYDRDFRVGPISCGEPFNLPNHPVVGVSWYEALAFTRWLTEYLQTAQKLPTDWRITLPSEAEWEKGARGGVQLPVTPTVQRLPLPATVLTVPQLNHNPTRTFPWENEQADPEWANYKATDVAGTSAVGCFPRGVSPYGVEEMAGNVWEWTRSLRDFDYPYRPTDGREVLTAEPDAWRVPRGGSWANDAYALGCVFRYNYPPYLRHHNIGFRVVVSPSPLVSDPSGL